MNATIETSTKPADVTLRRASVCQQLHWLATGEVTPNALAEAYLGAAQRHNGDYNAYVELLPELVREQAAAATRRRAQGVIGRLDGIPIAIKDNFDIAGWPTGAGLRSRAQHNARSDAHAIARLRAAGAILMGKTILDEAMLGAAGDNPQYGPTHNPFRAGYSAGGSSCGSAAAVAAGLAAAALGSDSLGSIRIPASYCGLYALKPTHGEISARGLVPAARRLDAVGILARSADDLAVMLQVLAGYDAEDPRSRRRRVALATPDWEPGRLRCGVLEDLTAIGVDDAVSDVFGAAVERLSLELGQRQRVDFSDWDFARTRRAGLLLMEAELRHTFAAELAVPDALSPRLRALLDYAASKNATDYVVADRVLDAAALKARRLFAQVDVLVLPTTPQGAFPLAGPTPASQADLTGFASLAACPAVSIPMGLLPDGLPIGLQFVGPPGSDLRLLELAGVCASRLDATPDYPIR